MLKQFMLDWKLQRKSQLLWLVSLLIPFLVGVAIVLAVMYTSDETVWYSCGTICMIGWLVLTTVIGGMSYRNQFSLALSMGRTRRHFMASYALQQLVWMVPAYLLILLFHSLEVRLYDALFPLCVDEIPFDFLTDWRIIVPAMPVLVLVNMFIGTVYCRYGKTGGTVLYFLWLGICIGLPRLLHEGSPLLALLLAIPTAGWIALAIAALAAMLAFILFQGRKFFVQ